MTGVTVRRGLLADHPLRAVAWGPTGDLWVTFQDGFGRIADPLSSARLKLFEPPRTGEGDALDPQTLAPQGPGGRIAVGSMSGYVSVSSAGDRHELRAFPIRAEPGSAGLMPWVGWTASGAVSCSVHLTGDIVVLDPNDGHEVWRRTESVARYPSGSRNGRFLLLPWAEAGAAAEILDTVNGRTLATLPESKPTRDYDPLYGSTGSWTTDMFVEAVYKTLNQKK